MKIKVLHVVGGSFNDGAYKGANILHKALLDLNIDSKLLNYSPPLNNPNDTLSISVLIISSESKSICILVFFIYKLYVYTISHF